MTTPTLLPYQEVGVRWLLDNPRCGLFDDQGLGKTVQIAAALAQLRPRRALVVCPTSVTWNWARELGAWAPELNVQVISKGSDDVNAYTHVVVMSHGMLLNSGLVTRVVKEWARDQLDVAVLDESQHFVHPTAARSDVFFLGRSAICRRSRRTWLSTGTPMANDPTELWVMLAGLAPERLRHEGKLLTSTEWRDRFCITAPKRFGTGLKVVGVRPENLLELMARLRGFALRRRKDEVLDLPQLRYDELCLTLPEAKRAALAKSAAEAEQIADEPTEVDVATWRRKVAEAKAPVLADLLCDELEGNHNKLVVAGLHLDALEVVANRLYDAGVRSDCLTGSVSARDRQQLVETFQQDDDELRVLCVQIRAGGTGVTLTAADQMVFLEQDWSPGANAQMRDRIYRIGQKRPVLIRYATAANTGDDIVERVLARKTAMIDALGY